MRSSLRVVFPLTLTLTLALVACKKEPPPEASGTRTSASEVTAASPSAAPASVAPPIAADEPNAEVGKRAPDFTLKDLDGKDVHLADFKGKTVVLEWFNPGCPFVQRSHTKGSLKDTAARHTKDGVVWLGVNSAAAGNENTGADATREGAKRYGMTHPMLLDPTGAVGHKYGATNTPHMFVIDGKGTLVYKGAIDNSPDGEGESPTSGKLVAYVDEALASVAAGKPVATPETKAYGCSVKYAR